MKVMKLSDIKIKDSFANTIPREEKMDECRNYWIKHHEQDRYIVVDHDNTLIDGYIQYLVLKEVGEDMAEIKIFDRRQKRWHRKNKQKRLYKSKQPSYRERSTVYIFGVHPNSKYQKERVWRVPANWWQGWADSLSIGDMLQVQTKYGLAPIIITRIEKLDKCPVDMPVKKVCRKVV